MILDVGCGWRNCHNLVENALHINIQHSEFVDIICDVQHLPFKNKSFSKSIATHIIEHVDEPIQLIKELIRVTRKTVELLTPHRFSLNAKQKANNNFDRHKWSFRPLWFHKVLKNFRHHLENEVRFFGIIYIHVWVYL